LTSCPRCAAARSQLYSYSLSSPKSSAPETVGPRSAPSSCTPSRPDTARPDAGGPRIEGGLVTQHITASPCIIALHVLQHYCTYGLRASLYYIRAARHKCGFLKKKLRGGRAGLPMTELPGPGQKVQPAVVECPSIFHRSHEPPTSFPGLYHPDTTVVWPPVCSLVERRSTNNF
jgi:hypothetical protein